ncbi:hypothetical protein ACF1AL_30845 [Streptomyces sp. NPDC014801]|uniref:hypothetical protein n=1 Tax=Streptomyces sp. NPDC014801 TaxID=3364916 RepID=UPI0036F5000A
MTAHRLRLSLSAAATALLAGLALAPSAAAESATARPAAAPAAAATPAGVTAARGTPAGSGRTAAQTPVQRAAASLPTPAARAPRPRPHGHVTVTFRTVPAVAGARFALGGQVVTSDGHGRATVTVARAAGPQTLSLLNPVVTAGDHQYRFVRWTGQRDPDQAQRTTVHGLRLRTDRTITAAYRVACAVSPRFTDQYGKPLDLGHISTVTVKSSTGRLTGMPVRGATWLDGTVPVYRTSRLQLTPVTYSLQSLVYDGAQLADAGRQRFTPCASPTVTFVGPFHALTVTAHDAFFGGATGRRAEISGPGGIVRTVSLGAQHSAVVTDLPRGHYRVTLKGAGGLTPTQEIQLSRSMTTNAPVISTLDLLVIGLPLLGLVVAGVLVRRARTGRSPFGRRGSRPGRGGPAGDPAGAGPP